MLYTFKDLLACCLSFLGFLARHLIFKQARQKRKLPVKMMGMMGPS